MAWRRVSFACELLLSLCDGYDLRESIDDSWTVVIGPSSGTLIFRRRAGTGTPWSFILNRRPPVVTLSVFSVICPMALAKASSGAKDFAGEAVDW